MANNIGFSPIEVGYFSPQMSVGTTLETGEVGYIATGLKDIHLAQVGDTVTLDPSFTEGKTASSPLPGYKQVKPMVFLGLFPIACDDFVYARESIEKAGGRWEKS